MRVVVTEHLQIDLDTEQWECRHCARIHGSARENYKHFMRVRARDPREVHRPLLDPERYDYTFAPDPTLCALIEFYCPGCAALVEVEYTAPGHPPLHDIELDLDDLRRLWVDRGAYAGPPVSKLEPVEVSA